MCLLCCGNLNPTLLLCDPTVDGDTVTWGNNEIINFEVEKIHEFEKLIKKFGCETVMPLEKVGKFLILQFKDTEGNVVEVYETGKVVSGE